ncbi:MAG: glycosyltransferase family 4 protein [Verrucomicrobiae bacterium]|nr:glycosyltransferase family 4 protein [Verrucomicrobiae bacterium]
MKICLFNVTSTIARIGSAEIGGLEAHTFRLANALARRGHEAILFGGMPPGEGEAPVSTARVRRFLCIETSRVPDLGTRFRRLAQRLHFAWGCRREFLAERFDACLVFKTYDFPSVWEWRRRGWRGRAVARLSGEEFFATDRFFARAVDAIYAVSARLANAAARRYGRVCPVIPNFVEASPFAAPEDPPVILAAGRLVGWKGFDVLLRAFARIEGARLVIAGDGPERGRLEALARNLGLAGRVEFTEAIPSGELARRRAVARVAVQPSAGYDSCPNAALEALGAGLSLTASTSVDVPACFDEVEAVRRFRAGDAEGLAMALRELLDEPLAAWRMRGARARALTEDGFSEERLVSRLEELLKGEARGGSLADAGRRDRVAPP